MYEHSPCWMRLSGVCSTNSLRRRSFLTFLTPAPSNTAHGFDSRSFLGTFPFLKRRHKVQTRQRTPELLQSPCLTRSWKETRRTRSSHGRPAPLQSPHALSSVLGELPAPVAHLISKRNDPASGWIGMFAESCIPPAAGFSRPRLLLLAGSLPARFRGFLCVSSGSNHVIRWFWSADVQSV